MMQGQPHQEPTAKIEKQQSKIKRLLNNPDIKRWYDNLSRGSPLTAECYLYRLHKFCTDHQITPIQFVELARKDLAVASDLMQDSITMYEEKSYAPAYIDTIIKAVKSWVRQFDIEIKRKMKIRNIESTPTLENERIPNASEITEILNRARLREAVIISFIAKAGLRPEVLGNYNATDGLMITDLPDIAIVQGIATLLRSPPRVMVRRTLSKAKFQYFTLLTSQATKQLLAYMNDRLTKGEALNSESPVIAPDSQHRYGRGRNGEKKFLTTQHILRQVRTTLRPRFQWRPYVFRRYFDTQLLIAESRGKIAHDFRVFFMGHSGSIEATYTTNKGVLDETLVNEMREAFKRSEELLDLELKEEDPLLRQKETLHTVIEKATPEQMQKMFQLLDICNT